MDKCPVQFSHSVMSNSLQPHESQHARPPCPSPTPGVHSNSCPSSLWCHPAISSPSCPLLLLPPIPPSIRVFSNELTLRMRWPKYWSFSFSISPSIGWFKKLRAINSIHNYTWANIVQYKVKKIYFWVHICKISLHFLAQSFPQLSQNNTCFF